jgi:hypothetical protein
MDHGWVHNNQGCSRSRVASCFASSQYKLAMRWSARHGGRRSARRRAVVLAVEPGTRGVSPRIWAWGGVGLPRARGDAGPTDWIRLAKSMWPTLSLTSGSRGLIRTPAAGGLVLAPRGGPHGRPRVK